MARSILHVVTNVAHYTDPAEPSFTNALVIDVLRSGKKPRVPVRDDTLRTLIWTQCA